jgi:hypothetical protein
VREQNCELWDETFMKAGSWGSLDPVRLGFEATKRTASYPFMNWLSMSLKNSSLYVVDVSDFVSQTISRWLGSLSYYVSSGKQLEAITSFQW